MDKDTTKEDKDDNEKDIENPGSLKGEFAFQGASSGSQMDWTPTLAHTDL